MVKMMAQHGGVQFSVWGFCLFLWQPRGVMPWPKMVSWCTCCLMMEIYSTAPTVKFTRTWLNLSVTTWCHPHTIRILWKTSSQVQAAQKRISGNVCVCIYVCERLTSFLQKTQGASIPLDARGPRSNLLPWHQVMWTGPCSHQGELFVNQVGHAPLFIALWPGFLLGPMWCPSDCKMCNYHIWE